MQKSYPWKHHSAKVLIWCHCNNLWMRCHSSGGTWMKNLVGKGPAGTWSDKHREGGGVQFGIQAPWTNRLHSQATVRSFTREGRRPGPYSSLPALATLSLKIKLANAFTLQVLRVWSGLQTEHFVLFSLVSHKKNPKTSEPPTNQKAKPNTLGSSVQKSQPTWCQSNVVVLFSN